MSTRVVPMASRPWARSVSHPGSPSPMPAPRFHGPALAPVLSADAMRAWDHASIEVHRVPQRVLMEAAGRTAAAVVHRLFPCARVAAATGGGNNGGDALVLLRTLRAWGRDVVAVPFAHAHGLTLEQLNLGNVHFGTGRRQVSPSVFLAEAELQALQGLAAKGVRVEARAVPAEKSLELSELAERWAKGG